MDEGLRVLAALLLVWIIYAYPITRGIAGLALGIYMLITGEVFWGIFITALGVYATNYFWVNRK